MDSPPRKINPDSPKEICVKLMLTWSGIWGESWLDRINPLSAPGLREKGFQRFSYAYSSVEGKTALSSAGRQRGQGGSLKQEWVMRRCLYSGGISHLIALDLSLTFYHTVHLLGIYPRESSCCHPQQPAGTPTSPQVSNPARSRLQWGFYLMLMNLLPCWASESTILLLGAVLLQWMTSPNPCRSAKAFL